MGTIYINKCEKNKANGKSPLSIVTGAHNSQGCMLGKTPKKK
jgi:hypothetical protein